MIIKVLCQEEVNSLEEVFLKKDKKQKQDIKGLGHIKILKMQEWIVLESKVKMKHLKEMEILLWNHI